MTPADESAPAGSERLVCPALLVEMTPIPEPNCLAAFVDVTVQDVADQQGLVEAGPAVFAPPADVVRSQIVARFGTSSAASVTGASAAVLDHRRASFPTRQGPPAVDDAQRLACPAQNVGSDRAVAPPPAQQSDGDPGAAVATGR